MISEQSACEVGKCVVACDAAGREVCPVSSTYDVKVSLEAREQIDVDHHQYEANGLAELVTQITFPPIDDQQQEDERKDAQTYL